MGILNLKALSTTVASAAGILVLSSASLAVAGVDLPDPAADTFAKLGLELPNQDGDSEDSALAGTEETSDDVEAEDTGSDTSQAVKEVVGDRSSYESGCEFGQAVATAASGDDPNGDKDPCDHAPNTTGEEHSSAGQEQADAHRNAEHGSGNESAGAESEHADGAGKPDDAGPPAGVGGGPDS